MSNEDQRGDKQSTLRFFKAKSDELEAILDSINDGFFTLNRNFNFTYVNKAFERICNCDRKEIIGTNYWKKFPKAVSLKFYDEYNRVLKTGISAHFEEYASSLDRWVYVNVYPERDGLAVYFIDVTEQRNARLTIEAQNERLKEIAWMVSHDVRGPVASILGLIPLINYEQPADEDNRKVLKGIKDACMNLDKTIKEMDEKTKVDINLFQ